MLRIRPQNFWILFLLFVSFIASAKPQLVELRLTHIEAKKTAERGGDEVYFTITEYPAQGEAKLLRIPIYPMHWLSKELPKLTNVKLWQGNIVEGNAVLLIISLMEQNFPLFETDQHIGSVQVKLVNKNNTLQTLWGKPHFVDQPKVEQVDAHEPKFMMFGDNSQYAVELKIQEIH